MAKEQIENVELNEDKSRILQEIKSLSERERILRENALRIEDVSIKIEFTEAEIEEITEKQVRVAIQIEKEEIRKKEFMDEWNDVVKPKKAEQRLLLDQLDKGYKYVEMALFAIQNFDDRTMDYYDGEGFLRHSRPLMDNEFQTRIS